MDPTGSDFASLHKKEKKFGKEIQASEWKKKKVRTDSVRTIKISDDGTILNVSLDYISRIKNIPFIHSILFCSTCPLILIGERWDDLLVRNLFTHWWKM